MIGKDVAKSVANIANTLQSAGVEMAASICDGITGTNTATELNKQAKAVIDALPLVGNRGGQER